MLITVNENTIPDVKEYIADQYCQCIYLYMNLCRYGASNPWVNTYTDSIAAKIDAVYMMYYDCLHFFSRDRDYPPMRLLEMIDKWKPNTVFMPQDWSCALAEDMDTRGYHRTDMDVVCADSPLPGNTFATRAAEKTDLKQLAGFMMQDHAYAKIYKEDLLYRQLLERFEDGFGRFHLMECDGRIAAAYGTNAETDTMAVMGGLLTAPEYRRRGYGRNLIVSVWNEIIREGKTGFALIEDPGSRRLHLSLGCRICATVSKYYFGPKGDS